MSEENEHLARIDVLRGVAILMVVPSHAYGAAFNRDQSNSGDWSAGTIPRPEWSFLALYPFRFGRAGVSLFFVPSGHVVHRSYLRTPRFTWSDCASRRFWRIHPAYFSTLAAFALWQHRVRALDFVFHAGLLQNARPQDFFSTNPSSWSLAVEVQLYTPSTPWRSWHAGCGALVACSPPAAPRAWSGG